MRTTPLLALLALLPASLLAQAAATPASTQPEAKEWQVPWGASTRPRDPYADSQGRVWFVGQEGNYVAWLDSKTGEFRRYEIDPGTNPHNLVVAKGAVWFTGNRNGRLVRLEPLMLGGALRRSLG